MKKIGLAFVLTVLIFFFSLTIAPIISNIGYSSADGSYHAATHGILISLIFTVIVCTLVIKEEIIKNREEYIKYRVWKYGLYNDIESETNIKGVYSRVFQHISEIKNNKLP